ncbi:aldose epimerase family protein [Kocuria sp.]|uniref:aldose epimerase family protein n=1 Tax=Kocuria sp. TaxID=1871328 RepID=UPI0026E0996B|nr:aldose epimerase family protein [Kocuria sp.]MDO5618085.1 aldose epimerase family protein [Kocuria sp.]
MSPQIRPFGHTSDGLPVHAVTLGDPKGVELTVLDLGAAVQSLLVPDQDGRVNLVLGHADAEGYAAFAQDYLGVLVGRYANRIAGASFELEGQEYELPANNGSACHHGGPEGFSHRVWDITEVTPNSATFELTSPHLDQGFPGEMVVRARYSVEGGVVVVEVEATADRATVFGPTSHVYWNLAGEGRGSADGHVLTVAAQQFLPVDDDGLPSGPLRSVAGTPLDFRTPAALGDVVRADHPQVHNGVDHSFAISGTGVRYAATLTEPVSGRSVEVHSDLPGLQVYTSNFFDGRTVGTSGTRYRQGDGIALEPQFHPDTPNRPELGDPVLRPGRVRRHRIEWRLAG